MKVRMKASGDSGLIVEFGSVIDPQTNRRISAAAKAIEARAIKGVIECVPTYGTILIVYNPLLTGFEELQGALSFLAEMGEDPLENDKQKQIFVIPVCYGGDYGPDLEYVADYNHIAVDEVIRLHGTPAYLVYMLGFTPGFPYLGGMDKRIVTPRLLTPRKKIPAGSVGIAGHQTGIYPVESPGGWQIIGRTPVKLFDPERTSPALLFAGAGIRFKAVDEKEYKRIKARVEENAYEVEILMEGGGIHETNQS